MISYKKWSRLGWILILWVGFSASFAETAVTIGAKKFTESIVLANLAAQWLKNQGINTQLKKLGGSQVLWRGLLNGDIDIYPDYTGTLIHEIFAQQYVQEDELQQILAEKGVGITKPLGFDNTYALGMVDKVAGELNIRNISDLIQHADLTLGFSSEFMARADGWPKLQAYYQLPQQNVRGLDHDLAYRALEQNTLQVIDIYATDADIQYYKLRVLNDDLHYFPHYKAVFLYRLALLKQSPEIVSLLEQITGKISQQAMIDMNSQVELGHISDSQVAVNFLKNTFGVGDYQVTQSTFWQRLYNRTCEHLMLVGISLGAAIIVAIPLGIFAAYRPKFGHIIIGIAGVIQTIPALAMLVVMIPLVGVGGPPAMIVLFLYSLLPILRNTHTGLKSIPLQIIESAQALGLPSKARLRLVELPMAARTILAGIKTSAVINVGTATLGALIGAGGYGQPILTGIRLDDTGLILEGAIPSAILALLVQGLFTWTERHIVSDGLS
ncbi:glycine betaine ABC transporter substrate-binding protein [Candidatus Nitrosacidococcus tergens]|uniref:ABC transporter, permease component n=1 Tax=Candidatus Nitrosacidococcus tergens TaxID=553981 RepID=A0A7G1Q879_9GAMM|nr:glycine betaine ABC transporter substrate-binding protein [Candidatus Nitrosacidococcus tergens]CAB1275049.1 ABC transporter, permease component [Candidatus Nitrosacidococcus tergens]